LYFESVGLNGVSEEHVLHVIQTTSSLANDPIIRDARAILGSAQTADSASKRVHGVVPLPARARGKYLVDPETLAKQPPQMLGNAAQEHAHAPPDVASVAFAGTTGDTEAGAFNAIDLVIDGPGNGKGGRNGAASLPSERSGIGSWFGWGQPSFYEDPGRDEEEGAFYDFEGAQGHDEEEYRKYTEYLDGEVRRVQETMRAFLLETVSTRAYRAQSAVGCGPQGPWYSLCSITYAADAHDNVISWAREQYAENARGRRRKEPYCEDVLVYMSEGPVFGTIFVFRFDEEPNPEPVEVDGPQGNEFAEGAGHGVAGGRSYAEMASREKEGQSQQRGAMSPGEFAQAAKFD